MFTFLIPGCGADRHFPSDEELLDLIRTRVEQNRAIGFVIGVLEADGTTRIVSYGDAGPNARALGARSVFEIGSITKVFTGILLADMVAQGEVSLSDPVSDYLPSRVTMPSQDGREITLLDLATHHSGLPGMPSDFTPAHFRNPFADYSVEDLYDFLSSYELRRDIGSKYEYSNLAVGLLGVVLERVGGRSYEDLVRERILEPLGMNMTGITLEGDMLDWMADGHTMFGNVVPLLDFQAMTAAGALRSNAEDLLTFLAANIGEPETQLERSIRDSHEVQKSINAKMGIGLNWLVFQNGDEMVIAHGGGTTGFHTFVGFDPNKGVGVVVLTNPAQDAAQIGFHLINPKVSKMLGFEVALR